MSSADPAAAAPAAAVPLTRWTPLRAALIAGGLGVAFLPVPLWVVETWLGGLLGGAAAGLLTLPICLVLAGFATRRPAWAAAESAPDRAGAEVWLTVMACAVGGVMLWARRADDALLLAGVLLPVAGWLWLWGALGWARARALTFPVAFLGFALPWEHYLRGHIDAPLQQWTADIALQGLRIAGYPMRYWTADTIYSADYYVIVNETCSGMNMLTTLAMYTLIYGWLVQPRVGNRLVLLALVFPLAMLANGARVATIYLLGHYGGVPAAEGFWHTGSAYVIFLPVFWFIYAVDRALTARDLRHAARAPSASSAPQSAIHQSPSRT
ncbi:MAG: exosortase/archaeosortase family protein [Myxococcales bacterium]|nr:exosortase/archaeosortase family protein [Myxococcales bacterium]